jgi:hypothetical protein
MSKTTPIDMVNGSPRVPRPVAMRRLEVCDSCPSLHMMFCKECGCFMPAKTKLAKAECPLGKWGEEPSNDGAA